MGCPLVSIIVPVYNAERFLNETLNSIKSQTYNNLEVLVINDSSSDNSVEIIEKFVKSDFRFRYFYNTTNQGVSHSTNVGLSQCKGEYITFHDHDDVMLPSKISSCVEILENNTELDGVITIAEYISEDGSHLGTTTALPDYITNNPFFVRAFERSYIPTWAMFMRRDVINKLEFDDNIKIGNQDADFFLRMLYRRPQLYYLSNPQNRFRQVTKSLSKKSTSTFEIYKKHNDVDIAKLYTQAGYSKVVIDYALAKANLWRENIESALNYIRSAHERISEFDKEEKDNVNFIYATCLYLNQLFEPCLEILQKIEGKSFRAETLNNQGVCWAIFGDLTKARDYFESALSILPEYIDPKNNLFALNASESMPVRHFTKFPLRSVYKTI